MNMAKPPHIVEIESKLRAQVNNGLVRIFLDPFDYAKVSHWAKGWMYEWWGNKRRPRTTFYYRRFAVQCADYDI